MLIFVRLYLQGFVKALITTNATEMQGTSSELAARILNVKNAMKGHWTNALQYGISNEVFMVEVEVVQRLIMDNLLWFAGDYEKEWLIRVLRRDSITRYQFAACVGKRLLSERIMSRFVFQENCLFVCASLLRMYYRQGSD